MGKSEAYTKITAMRSMARSYHRIRTSMGLFDTNPMLLNAANCAVDLQTGEAIPHSPEQMFRHQSPVAYDTEADCPMWKRFVAQVQPDPEMQAYLQAIVGYSLTGRMDEHAFFIHVGTGGNGKTTFFEVVNRLLGDYGQKLERETLLSKPNGGSSSGLTPDIARMAGARLLLASEIPKGRSLDDDRVKELVGGDTQTARNLFEKPFDFIPTAKIHMLTNHLPGLDSGGQSMGRRLRIVPWTVEIPRESIDKTLKERMIMTEAAGILRWIVEGAVMWAQNGLQTPQFVYDRSEEHIEESDALLPFIHERLDVADAKNAYESEFAAVYGAYRSWCDMNGNRPMSGKAFSQSLVERLGHEIRFRHWQNRRSMFRVRVRLQEVPAEHQAFFDRVGR
jgi:putative DNA primase/helicase